MKTRSYRLMKTMSEPNSSGSPPPSNTTPHVPPNIKHETLFIDCLISVFIVACSILAWACAMFVPAWKIVDVSYLFRVSPRR
jgi:hypothetical protein